MFKKFLYVTLISVSVVQVASAKHFARPKNEVMWAKVEPFVDKAILRGEVYKIKWSNRKSYGLERIGLFCQYYDDSYEYYRSVTNVTLSHANGGVEQVFTIKPDTGAVGVVGRGFLFGNWVNSSKWEFFNFTKRYLQEILFELGYDLFDHTKVSKVSVKGCARWIKTKITFADGGVEENAYTPWFK